MTHMSSKRWRKCRC